jgi:hypothetical protein
MICLQLQVINDPCDELFVSYSLLDDRFYIGFDNFDKGRKADVTGHHEMLIPPWHLILPSLCRGSV